MAKRTPNKKGKSTTPKKDVAEQKEAKAVETQAESETNEDSDDDEAPEIVSLETGKQLAEESQQQAQQAAQKLKQVEKEKRRQRDQFLKEQKTIKKQKLQDQDDDEEDKKESLPAPLPSSLLESAENDDESAENKHIREFPDDSHLKVNPERWNLIKNQEKHVDGFKVVSLEDNSGPYPQLKLDGRALGFLHRHLYKNKNRVPVILNMSRKEVGPAINFIRSEAAKTEFGPRAQYK
ncbi:hypothetical protein CONCODRAFT_78515 [Conidiobolus coronatus NRRL 28638]|uniref:Uncharacterized protein n=1 Tax=Conidiobolus coronatus (strain ATCC 28846 / CBS 209.66 / NRRL 28638) TaxID=796925 RepID=A0A137P852_CONC2|nr:hypothetical protein CONCODRAFT_78515 [Conidiobolus coronatus NRRL 28638]|eukprot:KXN71124.1 hypothetical protein CONCODRAFT_78515 [Conidiobolus coronatus NRRL 28638]